MEIKKLGESNPWWLKGAVPIELKGQKREEYSHILKSVNIKEIILLIGIRRAGKSTFMYQMIDFLLATGAQPEQILFVNLEDNTLANDNLDEIYREYRVRINPDKKAYIFLDEIHRKKGWESWIRKQYDLNSNCKFVISGSCSYLLKKEYSTLLTGRNLTFEIFPLSFREFLNFTKISINAKKIDKETLLEVNKNKIIKALNEYLNIGGFPDVVLKEKEFKIRVLAQYFEDIIHRDIVDRYDISSQKTKDLALYLITNFTSIISLRNLRNTLGLSYDAIKEYLSYYKDAFLFFVIEHFAYSLKEQKTKPSKVYCIDNGLRNAVSFKFSKDEGKLAENLVFVELKRRNKEVYYWKNKGEVDFIIKNPDNTLIAINVHYSDEINERETKALLEFKNEFKKTRRLIILTKDLEKKEKGVFHIPLWKWLLEDAF